jgi:hypothetical protein
MLKMRMSGGFEVCALVTVKVTAFKDVMKYFLVGRSSLLLAFCHVDGGNAFAYNVSMYLPHCAQS